MNNNKLSDRDLMFLLQNKDEKALGLIYDLYAPCLYGLIIKKVKDEKLASDILQNTFTRIWKESIEQESFKNRLVTWLIAATYKTALADFNINLASESVQSVIKMDTLSVPYPKYRVLGSEF